MKKLIISLHILAVLLAAGFTAAAQEHRTYTCYRTTGPIKVDGRLSEADWQAAPLSEAFADIRGVDYRPAPAKETRMKMLWDDECLYIAGIIEEDDVTASLKERDAIIYRDNDFEVFIDPEGDGKFYFEFECNAFGTLMDLIMDRPYFRGGSCFLPWDCRDVRLKVHVDGKVNDSRKPDKGWTVEMAIPFKSLAYGQVNPKSFRTWRINFSRVQWVVKDGPEENWVWNPTGKVNMHMPENWGWLKFADTPVSSQSQNEMRETVEYLASPELGGRFPATAGDTLASSFLAGELRRLNLKGIVNEKDDKGFYQDFTFGKMERKRGHNIVGVLPGNDKELKDEYIVVGAHYDHLGMGGKGSGSRRPDTLGVHPGADDNASGDAVILELAKHFTKTGSPRSIIFAFFGAEEQGIVGSKSFVEWMKGDDPRRINLPSDIKGIVAMVNLDMVGRMRDSSLSVSGTGTSTGFQAIAEKAAGKTGLHITCTPDGYGPSDQASFVAADIPVLYLTTGGHMEYHTPEDVPATLDYAGMQQALDFTKELVSSLAGLSQAPDFINVPNSSTQSHAAFKVTLGLMPDVTGASATPGLRADIVVAGKPAHKAGMKNGDIIQEIDGKPVTGIEDYMQRLSELQAGTTIPVKVLRGGETIILQVELNTSEK